MECDYLKALNLAREGCWAESHEIVQQYSDNLSCLIYAYLHQAEGDIGNAKYWYRRAGAELPNNHLEAELNKLYEMTNKPKM